MMIRPLATDAGDANEVNGQNEKPFATADDAADDANDEEEKEERSSDGSVKNPPIAILTVHTGLHSGLHTCTSPATLLCLDHKLASRAFEVFLRSVTKP